MVKVFKCEKLKKTHFCQMGRNHAIIEPIKPPIKAKGWIARYEVTAFKKYTKIGREWATDLKDAKAWAKTLMR